MPKEKRMSLSNPTEQTKCSVNEYTCYELEPFECLDGSPNDDRGCCDFEACFCEPGAEEEPFRYEPSDGRDRAQVIIEKAHKDAGEIVAEAKKKIAAIEKEAYDKGYAQGEKDGRELGAKKLDKMLDKIHDLFQDILNQRSEFRRLYEAETLDLICRIAEKVVYSRVALDNEVVRDTILAAFDLAADRTEVKIRVHPGDIEFVKDLRPLFFERVSDLKSITMESDPSVGSGGCLMETAFGHVDARIESQLEKIFDAVREALNAAPKISQAKEESN